MGNCLGKKGRDDTGVEYYRETEKLREEGAAVEMNTSNICAADHLTVAMDDDFVTKELELESSPDHYSSNLRGSLNKTVLLDTVCSPTQSTIENLGSPTKSAIENLGTPTQPTKSCNHAYVGPASSTRTKTDIPTTPQHLDVTGIANDWYCDQEEETKSSAHEVSVEEVVEVKCTDSPAQFSQESQICTHRSDSPPSSGSDRLDMTHAATTVVSDPLNKMPLSPHQQCHSPLVDALSPSHEETIPPQQAESSCAEDVHLQSQQVDSNKRLSTPPVSIFPSSSHQLISRSLENIVHSTPTFLIPISDALPSTLGRSNISLAASPMSVSAMSQRASHLSCYSDNYSPVYRLEYNLETGNIHEERLADDVHKADKPEKGTILRGSLEEERGIIAAGEKLNKSLNNECDEKAGQNTEVNEHVNHLEEVNGEDSPSVTPK